MLALLLALSIQEPARDSFPHLAHARLFVSCTTCHDGIRTGRAGEVMPQPQECRTCHDGQTEATVNWAGARLEPSNLRFSHERHGREVRQRGDSALACQSCHALAGAATFMAAGRAPPERCLGCHAHEVRGGGHLEAQACSQCHVPLREARGLSIARISRLPTPRSHDSGFAFNHREAAQSTTCQTCHTRESCTACHVNGARVPEIVALGSDARVAAIAALSPRRLPEPPSHQVDNFTRGHGALPAAGMSCSTCHTRQSCQGCHGSDAGLAAISALPDRPAQGGGVDLGGRLPPDHGAGFLVRHRSVTASSDQACASCHTQRFCVSCHAAAASDRYHAANFVQRHSAAAYSGEMECSSCHQVTAFCSACHRETGSSAAGSTRRGAFHDGVNNWLFAHGAVARRSLETCASCHTQSSCTACHSSRRGLQVSPHGPRPPEGDRRRAMCAVCHS